jgi:hypothetical protein
MSIPDRAALGAVFALFAAVLAACGDSEADQRKAFIGFLQDINGSPAFIFSFPRRVTRKLSDLTCSITRSSWTIIKI